MNYPFSLHKIFYKWVLRKSSVVTFWFWRDKLHISFSLLTKEFKEISGIFPVFPILYYRSPYSLIITPYSLQQVSDAWEETWARRMNIRNGNGNSAVFKASLLKMKVGQSVTKAMLTIELHEGNTHF